MSAFRPRRALCREFEYIQRKAISQGHSYEDETMDELAALLDSHKTPRVFLTVLPCNSAGTRKSYPGMERLIVRIQVMKEIDLIQEIILQDGQYHFSKLWGPFPVTSLSDQFWLMMEGPAQESEQGPQDNNLEREGSKDERSKQDTPEREDSEREGTEPPGSKNGESQQGEPEQEPGDEQPEVEDPEDEQPEGEDPEDERPEGEDPEDERPEGEDPEDERPEGEDPEDEQPEGEDPEDGEDEQEEEEEEPEEYVSETEKESSEEESEFQDSDGDSDPEEYRAPVLRKPDV
ncbi:uncharacterized protein KY384_007526 [Bacidia gigantensis]|uniref:uncharacterized protein n=1 Tax=Bacidia gigantensis TaxID=2732470 RepID=UPI001D0517D1|nr:uncharacterized protein KY384_007526 [Bacidia gigantensis]KAG8527374.1 hypothetical protein KY384_007526 [Bacidia gigantensis]